MFLKQRSDGSLVELSFPSGEALPRFWLDPAYQLHQSLKP